MDIMLILGGFFVGLFLLVFFTKRRFGVLGLALAAGATLSSLWATELTPYFAHAITVERPPLQTIVATLLVLLPAIVLLFGGPAYHDFKMRIFGAICFALLAAVFLIEPIGNSIVLTDQNRDVYMWLESNKTYIVTAGLVIAILDVMLTRKHKPIKAKH